MKMEQIINNPGYQSENKSCKISLSIFLSPDILLEPRKIYKGGLRL